METVRPTFEITGFNYAANVPGHIGFEVSFGLYSYSTFDSSTKIITCTIQIENKPIEVIVRALGTWGRKSKPLGVATFTPPADFFTDLPAPETPTLLIVTPIEK